MKHDLTFLKPLVSSILQDERRSWTVQGFGFPADPATREEVFFAVNSSLERWF